MIAHVLGIHPWMVGRYKPHELEAAKEYAKAWIGVGRPD